MGIPLGSVQKVLVRFFSYKRSDFPENIRVIPRKSTTSRDKKHAAYVGEEIGRGDYQGGEIGGLSERGRIRMGRVDTGDLVFNGVNGVTFPTVAGALIADDYAIVNAHVAEKMRRDRMQYIFTFTFDYDAEPAENAVELRALFQRYAEDHYDVFVWENPDASVTINCMNRNGGKRRQRLGIVGGEIDLVDIASA